MFSPPREFPLYKIVVLFYAGTGVFGIPVGNNKDIQKMHRGLKCTGA